MLSFDIMIATSFLLIVLAILVAQVSYNIKSSQEFADKSSLMSDLDKVSNIFFEEGIPGNWTSSNVQTIGLESNGRISLEKLGNFSQMPYSNTIILVGLNSDYNITVYSKGNSIYSFGRPYGDSTSVLKKDRIGVLENGTLVEIRVLVFER